jgi:hypothetical protein
MNIYTPTFKAMTDGSEERSKILADNVSLFDAINACRSYGSYDAVIVSKSQQNTVAFFCGHTKTVKGLLRNTNADFLQAVKNLQLIQD